MPKVLLLYTKREYATALASSVRDLDTDYEVDVVSRVPVPERVRHLLFEEYDIIHVDELMVSGVLGSVGALLSNVPLVASLRGWADYTNAHGQYGTLKAASIALRSRAILRLASKVLFFGDVTRQRFTERYPVDNPVVVGRPIDVEFYGGGSPPNEAGDSRTIVTVTNFRYRKKLEGVTTILEGLRDAFDGYENLEYRVVGDGQYLDALRSYLDSYPYADRVELLGYRSDIPNVLAASDLFVYVSYLDAFPTVVLEAQAAGLPVIGGNAVGVPDVVGEAGLVCQATADGIAGAIARVLGDESLRADLAERSRGKMRTYNERCAREHVAVWDDVFKRQ